MPRTLGRKSRVSRGDCRPDRTRCTLLTRLARAGRDRGTRRSRRRRLRCHLGARRRRRCTSRFNAPSANSRRPRGSVPREQRARRFSRRTFRLCRDVRRARRLSGTRTRRVSGRYAGNATGRRGYERADTGRLMSGYGAFCRGTALRLHKARADLVRVFDLVRVEIHAPM